MACLDITPLILLISALAVTTLAQEVELEIRPEGPYKKGDSVKFICETTLASALDLVMFYKEVNGKKFELSTNGLLNSEVQSTNRYQMMMNPGEAQSVKAEITISGVQGEDSGNIICTMKGQQQTEFSASETFEVQVPPKSAVIEYYMDGQTKVVQPGGTILLAENKDGGIMCKVEVEGSSNTPSTSITLDGVDITGMFTPAVNKTNQLWKQSIAIEYEYLTREPEIDWNGKELKCTTQTSDGFAPIETTAKIEVHYAPRLTCSHVHSKVGEKVEILCTGSMFPTEIQTMEVSWGKKPDRSYLTQEVPDHEGHHLKINDNANGNYEFVLTIDEVSEVDFGNYRFEVQNAHDHASVKAELIEVIVTTTTTTTEATKPDGNVPDSASTSESDTNSSDQVTVKEHPKDPGASSSATSKFVSSAVAFLFALLLTINLS